jgi:dihydroneopterin aldolase
MQTTIKINELEIYAHHGWFEQEQQIGNTYVINLEVDVQPVSRADELASTVDYVKLIEVIKRAMAVKSKTVEYVGNQMMQEILTISPTIIAVRLEIKKKNPPVSEVLDSFSVVFYEERKK